MIAVPQPFVLEYLMVSNPLTIATTIPELPIVATDVLEDDHVPPVVVLLNVIVLAAQTVDGPEIVPALGRGLIVRIFVTVAVPQLFVNE